MIKRKGKLRSVKISCMSKKEEKKGGEKLRARKKGAPRSVNCPTTAVRGQLREREAGPPVPAYELAPAKMALS